ncbi:hypothetical protein [Cerasicoccus fimbriatus]|uniref:hypothetical protein n=1 Tax=Cerasicoccus fimbriatus TaxID=3014554 RepID=UPI0022B5D251|nr:hypothetical protein [Cerasicoccus sp. TK19100]
MKEYCDITPKSCLRLLAVSALAATPLAAQTKIDIDLNRIYCEQSLGEPWRLFDEQDSVGDPINGTGTQPVSEWTTSFSNKTWFYPISAIVDLGSLCQIDAIASWDGGGQTLIEVEYGEPGNWTMLWSYTQPVYMDWVIENVDVQSRYLRITNHEVNYAPEEMVVYGSRLEPYQPEPAEIGHIPPTMDRLIAVNGFHNDPLGRLQAVGSLREYHNWYWNDSNTLDPVYDGDELKFNKSYTGNWNFDRFYRNIRLSGISTVADIKGSVPWIVEGGDSDHKPMPPSENRDALDPASYVEHARFLYQFAARYGSVAVDPATLTLHSSEPAITGAGTVRWMESWNEQDKWWRGREGYFSAKEYAAMASADIDGHLGTLGAGVGIHTADPNMKFAMSGTALLDLDYLKTIKQWCDVNRNGDFPFDAINFHHYCNDNGGQGESTIGVSPEADGLRERLEVFAEYRNRYLPGVEIWLSEFGYDTYQQSVQRAPAIGSMDGYEVQAAWILRSFLALSAAGIDRAHLYMTRDATSLPLASKYATSGLLERDANNQFVPKLSWFYTYTLKRRLTNLYFESEQDSGQSDVMIYRFADAMGDVRAIAVWCPTSEDKTVSNYSLDLDGLATTATLVEFADNSTSGIETALIISNDAVTIDVSETPVLVMLDDPEMGLGPDQLIPLTTANVVNEDGFGDATLIADEQATAVGAEMGTGGSPTTSWNPGWGSSVTWPNSVYIDLGEVTPVTYVYLYDSSSSGTVEISVGEPGNWEPLTTDGLTEYNVWIPIAIMRETRYVRITKHSQSANFNEIALFTNDSLPPLDGPEFDTQLEPQFTNVEVGASGSPAGSFAENEGQFVVEGSGVIATWRAWDTFHYGYMSATGDFDFSTRVDSLTPATSGSTAFLMARESLDDDVPFVSTSVGGTLAAVSQFNRSTTGQKPTEVRSPWAATKNWLRLERVGNVFNSYYSTDGVSWTLVNSTTEALPSTVYLGFGAASGNTTSLATAVFEDTELVGTVE